MAKERVRTQSWHRTSSYRFASPGRPQSSGIHSCDPQRFSYSILEDNPQNQSYFFCLACLLFSKSRRHCSSSQSSGYYILLRVNNVDHCRVKGPGVSQVWNDQETSSSARLQHHVEQLLYAGQKGNTSCTQLIPQRESKILQPTPQGCLLNPNNLISKGP